MILAAILALAWIVATPAAEAQSNVRAWSAAGQVFVVWQVDGTTPLTYDVYASPTPVDSTVKAMPVGRAYQPEWTGTRLKIVASGARWKIPSAKGGVYQLAANEGLFVHTPSEASVLHFAVVRNGNTAITATNRTASPVTVAYDPEHEPVRCHLQLSGITSLGYPYRTFAMWAYGRDDPTDARPDIPVLANAAKHGAPHVFTVFEPKDGLPPGPIPATVCLHGAGAAANHWLWAPDTSTFVNDGATPTSGVTVAMDDRVFVASGGAVLTDRASNWFGWWTGMDPNAGGAPPADAIVVPYTLRRIVWTMEWLASRSPYAVDPQRISVMGNSMGGGGALLVSRFRPDRFNAATAFVPQHYTPDSNQRFFGTIVQNLQTSETGPDGTPLHVNDFFDPAVRLSTAERDFCLTRIIRGRRDSNVEWGPLTIQLFNEMNAARWGAHLYWDNRDHIASDWTSDNPGTPAVDIGEWVHPVRTERPGVPYQGRYRADRSFPAFFDDDQNLAATGRQPTPGTGSPDNGTPWGTWGGYFDWDTETIFDTDTGWSCTMFLIGQSATVVDNFAGAAAKTSLAVRKPRRLVPAAGAWISWELRDDRTDAVQQSGTTFAEADGLVAVDGLVIPRDPQRVRLEFRVASGPRPGDLDLDGEIDVADRHLIESAPVDLDGDGVADVRDVELLDRYVTRYPCPGDLSGDRIVDAVDIAILLGAWGACPDPCPADIDANGIVDGIDIAFILAGWGSCDP